MGIPGVYTGGYTMVGIPGVYTGGYTQGVGIPGSVYPGCSIPGGVYQEGYYWAWWVYQGGYYWAWWVYPGCERCTQGVKREVLSLFLPPWVGISPWF